MRRRFTKAVDARRRARKAARTIAIKTGTKVIPDKRRKPEKHKPAYVSNWCGGLGAGFD